MATRANDQGPNHGVLGEVTIYQRQGKTIVRPRHNKGGGKRRTLSAMSQRTKMGNLVSVWRAFGKQLRGTFEPQKACSTDYTGFMSANERVSEVRLTKTEADFNFAIAGPYVVSQGQLTPSIEVRMEEKWMVSNISMGNNEIDDRTQVGVLASYLVYNNGGNLLPGDTLTFVRLTQKESPLGYKGMDVMYRLNAQVHQLVLDFADQRPLGVALGLTEVEDGWSVREGCLAAPRMERSFVAWIRSRKGTDGRVLASMQKLVGESDIFDRYSSWEQREKAIGSYGELEQNFYKSEVPLWEQKDYDQYVAEMKERQRREALARQREAERQREQARREEEERLERQREEEEYDRMIEEMIEEAVNPSNTVTEGQVTVDCLPPDGGSVVIYPPDEEMPDYLLYATPAEGWRFVRWSNGVESRLQKFPEDMESHVIAFFAKEDEFSPFFTKN